MINTQDYTKMVQDFWGAFPADTTSMQDAFRTSAAFGEKLSRVALEAAEKSTEISSKWSRDTIAKLGTVTTVKEEPTDYTKAFSDFASAQAEATTETMAAFAEVAKKVQMETVELMLAAGKDLGENATSAAKKATTDYTAATKNTVAA